MKAHLSKCEDCSRFAEMIREFPVSGSQPLDRPDSDAVRRYEAIPLLVSDQRNSLVGICAGAVVSDSWSSLPAAQLRDAGPGFLRRLCMEANGLSLEVVAERQQEGWEFTARVYESGAVSHQWVLSVGGRRLLPESLGFFHWSSKQAPRSVRLTSGGSQVQFSKLAWR